MRVVVRLHAGLKERAGRASFAVEAGDAPVVAAVRDALARACPVLAPSLPACRWAVHDAFVAADAPVPEGAALDCVPPVSGG